MSPDASLTVAIAHQPDNIEKAITQALSQVSLDDFREKVVAIKPNDTTARPNDKTACTQADTLRATIQFVKNLHPRRVVVSGGAGGMETEDVFKVLGFLDVIRSEGVEWFDHNRPPFVGVAGTATHWTREARRSVSRPGISWESRAVIREFSMKLQLRQSVSLRL